MIYMSLDLFEQLLSPHLTQKSKHSIPCLGQVHLLEVQFPLQLQ